MIPEKIWTIQQIAIWVDQETKEEEECKAVVFEQFASAFMVSFGHG